MTIVNDCKAKENANDEDAQIVINHEVPNSSTQKCLFACFYETIGVVSQMFYYFYFEKEKSAHFDIYF